MLRMVLKGRPGGKAASLSDEELVGVLAHTKLVAVR